MECSDSFQLTQDILMATSSSLSIISSLAVVFTIISKKLYKAYAFKILLYISLNDILRSFIGLVPQRLFKNSFLCKVMAYGDLSILFSNIILSTCLSVTIYQIIVLELTNFEKFHKYWIVSVLIAYLIYFLPFITSSYGYHLSLCELSLDFKGSAWRFGIFYFPSTILFLILYILLSKVYRKIKLIDSNAMVNVIFERGFIYPTIYSFILIPYMLLRIVQIFHNDCGIAICCSIFYALSILHGFFNSVIFFLNKTVKDVIKAKNRHIYSSLGISNSLGLGDTLKISFRSTLN